MEPRRRHIPADQMPKLYANLVFAPIRGLERENKLKMFDAASTSLVSFICKLLSVYVTKDKRPQPRCLLAAARPFMADSAVMSALGAGGAGREHRMDGLVVEELLLLLLQTVTDARLG